MDSKNITNLIKLMNKKQFLKMFVKFKRLMDLEKVNEFEWSSRIWKKWVSNSVHGFDFTNLKKDFGYEKTCCLRNSWKITKKGKGGEKNKKRKWVENLT